MTYDEAVAAIPPGLYTHFKGGDYEVIGVALHTETFDPLVIYKKDHLYARPADMWYEKMRVGNSFCPRFTRKDDKQ